MGERMKKAIIYYTDNILPEWLMLPLQKQLLHAAQKIPIISVSQKPVDFGENICIGELPRVYKSMCYQLVKGLQRAADNEANIIYIVEHDVIYHPSHFMFKPTARDAFFYDANAWMLRASDGQALHCNFTAVSLLTSYTNIALEHYLERLDLIKKGKLPGNCGFEPGSHVVPNKHGVGTYPANKYCAAYPSIDIRHNNNYTRKDRFSRQARKERRRVGWHLADGIPYWGKTKGRFREFIEELPRND